MTSIPVPASAAKPIKVVIVDDHPAVQGYLTQLLERTQRYRVVGRADRARDAIMLSRQLAPDLIILDLGLPDSTDLSCLSHLHADLPHARILVFTGRIDRTQVAAMLLAGADGIVAKTAHAPDLLAAIDRVVDGGVVLCPEASDAIRHQIRSRPLQPEAEKPVLTARELDVLQHIAHGLNSRQIAAKLGVSPNTVIAFRGRLLKKMGEHNATCLVLHAARLGLVQLPAPSSSTISPG